MRSAPHISDTAPCSETPGCSCQKLRSEAGAPDGQPTLPTTLGWSPSSPPPSFPVSDLPTSQPIPVSCPFPILAPHVQEDPTQVGARPNEAPRWHLGCSDQQGRQTHKRDLTEAWRAQGEQSEEGVRGRPPSRSGSPEERVPKSRQERDKQGTAPQASGTECAEVQRIRRAWSMGGTRGWEVGAGIR